MFLLDPGVGVVCSSLRTSSQGRLRGWFWGPWEGGWVQIEPAAPLGAQPPHLPQGTPQD